MTSVVRADEHGWSTLAQRVRVARALARGGCVAPAAEADALLEASAGGLGTVDELVARRLWGEPLAWITGYVSFCGLRIHVEPGLFVPRPHTEALALRAAEVLPETGRAVDLCTGTGAVAAVMQAARPRAEVVATDIDGNAVACARGNGVRALRGDLDGPLPLTWRGTVDLVTAVVPYVPEEELHLLPRDVLAHEPRRSLDGGPGGTEVLVRAADAAARLLAPGGRVLLEIGGDQADAVASAFAALGLATVGVHRDGDGRDRAIEARRPER